MQGNARKLAEKDESIVMGSGIPYTIIRAGLLQNTPGGKEGFSFKEVFFNLQNWPFGLLVFTDRFIIKYPWLADSKNQFLTLTVIKPTIFQEIYEWNLY